MHIPDGFLGAEVFAPAWIFSAAAVWATSKKASVKNENITILLLCVVTSYIIAAQMLNFPVVGGSSGHLIGGTLAAVILGPYLGFLSIVIVLVIQCLVFQDGGVTALGANIFNMAFIGSFVSYFLYSFLLKHLGKKRRIAAVALASWLSVVIAALACSFELALSGTAPLAAVLPAMLFVHTFIGIGEALITSMTLSFVFNVRPDIAFDPEGIL